MHAFRFLPAWLLGLCLPAILLHAQPRAGFERLRYPATVATVAADTLSVNIAYRDTGGGRHTLVLLHGLGSYQQVWQQVVPRLAARYRVVALDLPAHGRSSQGDFPYGTRFYAQAVLGLLQHLRVNKVVLVGHGAGGLVGAAIAAEHPRRVKGLVLVNPDQPESSLPGTRGTPSEMPDAGFWPGDAAAMRADSAYAQHLAAVQASATMRVPPAQLLPQLGQLRMPVLVLQSYPTEAVAGEAGGVAGAPNVQFVPMGPADYYLPMEMPDALAAAVNAFAARLR